MNLGDVIRAERDRRGWSIDVLVERIGDVTGGDRASLSKIETGQRWPRPAVLEAIASAFGLKVYQLFALAEKVQLPVAKATDEEQMLLRELKAMEPDVREHYLAIARTLTKR